MLKILNGINNSIVAQSIGQHLHTVLRKEAHGHMCMCINYIFIPFYINFFLVLNIGTSAQLSVIIGDKNKDEIISEMPSYSMLHHLPYFNNCYLIVAAALTGKKNCI